MSLFGPRGEPARERNEAQWANYSSGLLRRRLRAGRSAPAQIPPREGPSEGLMRLLSGRRRRR